MVFADIHCKNASHYAYVLFAPLQICYFIRVIREYLSSYEYMNMNE